MKDLDDWRALTGMAPVAPHFGDFVIGTRRPSRTHCRCAGERLDLGRQSRQYFAFRQPHWDDDIFTTADR
jgi:hypothetical protein